jgi:hypothetical protein
VQRQHLSRYVVLARELSDELPGRHALL